MKRMEEMITDCVLSLLKENSMRSITVRRVIEECGISRNGFYYHFASVGDVVERYFSDRVGRIIEECGEGADLAECLRRIERFFQVKRREILHLVDSVPREAFHAAFQRLCLRYMKDYIHRETAWAAISGQQEEILLRFYAAGIEGILMDWFEDKMRYDIGGMTDWLCAALKGSFGGTLKGPRAQEEQPEQP